MDHVRANELATEILNTIDFNGKLPSLLELDKILGNFEEKSKNLKQEKEGVITENQDLESLKESGIASIIQMENLLSINEVLFQRLDDVSNSIYNSRESQQPKTTTRTPVADNDLEDRKSPLKILEDLQKLLYLLL